MFSVIVPCYNMETKVNSLVGMYRSTAIHDYEVVFVDDCSSDATFDNLLQASKGIDNFHVIKTEQNGGPGAARNCGLKKASGDYVLFCDSDDEVDVNVLAEVGDFVGKYRPDLVVFPYMVKRNKEKIVDEYAKYGHGEQVKICDVAADSGTSCAKVYKKAIIDENNIEFPMRKSGEDKIFVVTFCAHAQQAYKYERGYYTYVMRAGSLTHSKATTTGLTTFEILEDIYRRHFPEILERMYAETYLLSSAKTLTAKKSGNKQIKEFFVRANQAYPNWINNVDYKNQNIYRKLIYKAIYKAQPLKIRFIMWLRRGLY